MRQYLKIKDNVKLNILEKKYGFIGYVSGKKCVYDGLIINNETRRIEFSKGTEPTSDSLCKIIEMYNDQLIEVKKIEEVIAVNDFQADYLIRYQWRYGIKWIARDSEKEGGGLYGYKTEPIEVKHRKFKGKRVLIKEDIVSFKSNITFKNSPALIAHIKVI